MLQESTVTQLMTVFDNVGATEEISGENYMQSLTICTVTSTKSFNCYIQIQNTDRIFQLLNEISLNKL